MIPSADETPLGARVALRRFMEWWSEETWCAGWLVGLEHELVRSAAGEDHVAFVWLVEQAGGWWTWGPEAGGSEFKSGAFDDLRNEAEAR